MSLRFRFAVISDPHVTLPQTFHDTPNRFHLVEFSIPALEQIFAHLLTLDLDFLLLPGDLTQHGEWANHEWLVQQLQALPFPAYVVPGNHDIIARDATSTTLGLTDFPQLYQAFGYKDPTQPYYCQEILPGVQLIGLNSISFDASGKQLFVGYLDPPQLDWLEATLNRVKADLVLVMLHHNVLEHLHGQAKSPLGQRYMVDNRQALISRLEAAGVPLMFTGHLHVQDIARHGRLCEVLTGSLVSYPHPYRVVEIEQSDEGRLTVDIQSHRITCLPDWPDVQGASHQWMCDRALPFMVKFLSSPPMGLPLAEAEAIAPQMKHFWATIADGDPQFDLSHLPLKAQQLLSRFNATDEIDNEVVLDLSR